MEEKRQNGLFSTSQMVGVWATVEVLKYLKEEWSFNEWKSQYSPEDEKESNILTVTCTQPGPILGIYVFLEKVEGYWRATGAKVTKLISAILPIGPICLQFVYEKGSSGWPLPFGNLLRIRPSSFAGPYVEEPRKKRKSGQKI